MFSEWSKRKKWEEEHTVVKEKKGDQKEIPPTNENPIEILNKSNNIDTKQELEQTRKYITEVYNNKPDCREDLYKLEEKDILHKKMSITEEMNLLKMEIDPNNYSPDDDESLKTAIINFLKHAKKIALQPFSSKKEIIKNNDRS